MNSIPAHQWTHDGSEVLLVKCVAPDGTSYGTFMWPLTVGAIVEAPDWTHDASCGGGLHGWPWGLAVGDGKDPDWTAMWLVFGATPDHVVDLGGKGKAKIGTIRYVGDWIGARTFVLAGQVASICHAALTAINGAAATGERSSVAATGERSSVAATGWHSSAAATGEHSSAAATGERSSVAATGWRSSVAATGWHSSAAATGRCSSAAATGGHSSAAATGPCSSAAATGWHSSAAATGWHSSAAATGRCSSAAATGGYSSAAATGPCSSAAVTSINGTVRGGPYGVLALAWQGPHVDRQEMRCARIGIGDGSDGLLKADVWYRLNEVGEFIEKQSA